MAEHPHFLWADLFRIPRHKNHSLVELLKENTLFCTLSNRELQYLSNVVYQRVFQPEEDIFQENDRGFGMYMIAQGRVAIKTHHEEGEVLVTTLNKGSFFGEQSLIDPQTIRSATAQAMERSVLIGFFKSDLTEILERKPQMGVKILYQLSLVLSRRLLETTEKITHLNRSKTSTPSPKGKKHSLTRKEAA